MSLNSSRYFSTSGWSWSAGRQVMTSSGLMPARARTSSLTSPGTWPYSPRRRPLDSLGKVLYLPTTTFMTAWVPTIWLVGVTSGG